MKKKNILAENMKRFGTKNLSEQEEYQSLGQQGEMPKLDPEADSAFVDQLLSSLATAYEQIKPKRLDMSEFENDVRDLVSIYKDKPRSNETVRAFQAAFRDLYPTTTSRGDYKSISSRVITLVIKLLSHAYDVDKGDTSNYGYRVHPWQKSKGI